MNINRPPDLTDHQLDVLELLLDQPDSSDYERDVLAVLRAATIMYPESTWLRDLARPWFQYQIDLKRAEVAADNAPAPEGWKPRCICGHEHIFHVPEVDGSVLCEATSFDIAGKPFRCGCTRYEPRDDT